MTWVHPDALLLIEIPILGHTEWVRGWQLTRWLQRRPANSTPPLVLILEMYDGYT